MKPNGRHFSKRLSSLAGAMAAMIVANSSALADLAHKYTFNDGTVGDPIGFADGTIVDQTGISFFAGGQIDLTANSLGSNRDFSLPTTVGAYVDLPNNVFKNAVLGGSLGQVSLEIWFTVQQNRNWAEVYSFGRSDMGENSSGGGGAADYVALIPQSGIAVPDYRATTHSAGGAETPLIGSATPLPTNVKHHVVLTIDLLDTAGGVNPNGTARLYTNNGAPVVGANQPLLDQIDDVNNWLGRSQWPDPLFDGLIDEFRIYNHAMTASEVSSSFTIGPDPSPTPTLVIDRATGGMSLANQANQAIQLKGYTISSAGGALNPPTWTSIDADNTFDTNGVWTKQTMTNLQLTESVTSGTLDGGSLAVSTSRGVGTPWRKSPTEDVIFSYTIGDNTTGFGAVQYVGNGGLPFGRSDFNADGDLTVSDWSLFLANAFTNFPAETTVGAYLKGDLDGDKDNDYQDFLTFKADYIAANGEAAFAALGAVVPEPGATALAASAALAVASVRRRRRS